MWVCPGMTLKCFEGDTKLRSKTYSKDYIRDYYPGFRTSFHIIRK